MGSVKQSSSQLSRRGPLLDSELKSVLFPLKQFARKDIKDRYTGSILGLGWAVLYPTCLLLAFTFVSTTVFSMKWPVPGELATHVNFGLLIFCGLLFFLSFSEVLTRSVLIIRAHRNLLTKSMFNPLVLPLTVASSAAVQCVISLGLLCLIALVSNQGMSTSWLLIPVVVFAFLCLLVGTSLWCSALGVYAPDLAQLASLLSTLLMFLSPIFYPLSALPDTLAGWLIFNPLVPFIEALREILFGYNDIGLSSLAAMYVWGIGMLLSGYFMFKIAASGFTDVL